MKECSACGNCYPDNLNHCRADGAPLYLSLRGDLILDERYKLERRLGRGGMGIVFKASHVFLKSAHAVKVILPDLVGDDPMLLTRFRQEAIVAASIRHKNVVLVTDYGVANNTMPFLVMELLVGKSLWDILTKQGRLSSKASLEIMEGISAGVGAAHRRNIVHRDLKPLNIFIQDGLPVSEGLKVLDFGLATIKSGELLGSLAQAQTTSPLGTPLYMAPEQWSAGEPDARADIYSIGVMLYQMLAGEPPFSGSSMPKVMKGHLMSPPPSFSSLGVDVSGPVEAVVRRALEKDPRDRQSSVDEFVAELQQAVTQEDSGLRSRVRSTTLADEMESTLPQVRGERRPEGIGPLVPDERLSKDDRSLLETQRQIEDEADRLMRELEEAQHRAEEARRRVEEAARRRAAEEAARRRAEAEAARKRAEEEEALKRAEEEQRKRVEAEETRKLAEEHEARRLAEEGAKRQAEEERARKLAEEESNRLSREVEEAQRRADEARRRADKEAQGRAKEEAARRIAEERAARLELEVEEAQQRAAEAHKRAEEEERRRTEQEAERQLAEEEGGRQRALEEAQRRQQEETAREHAEEDLGRLAREVEEAQRRVEEAHKRAEEETQRRVEEEIARKRAEEEASRLAQEVEEAKRRAEDARKLAEEERSRQAAKEFEPRGQDEVERTVEVGAIIAGREGDQEMTVLGGAPQPFAPDAHGAVIGARQASTRYGSGASPDVVAAQRQQRVLPLALLVIVVALLGVGGYGAYRLMQPGRTQPPPTDTGTAEKPIKSDMISIPGGTFLMGRNDVSQKDNNQWPAHEVAVKGFFMDLTEVTNAEYAKFVRQSGYQSPKSWPGNILPSGHEQWPVTDVSLDDARAFAAWRSASDGVKYRLPTEEEWEYAARGGNRNWLYPWGNTWYEDRANLGTGSGDKIDFPKPVGSYPTGASAWGVLDLIGNVWEWTASEALFYPGSGAELPSNKSGWFVVRGGCHQSLYPADVKAREGREFPATYRRWLPRYTTSSTVGFRLVRDAK